MSKAPTRYDDCDEFTQGYLECLLWSSTDENANPLDDDFGVRDFTRAAILESASGLQRLSGGAVRTPRPLLPVRSDGSYRGA